MTDQQLIHILPEFIANQIAAGEVVQRPESVVKELVENSLDAGSTHVTVVVRQSGKSLIHVVDNGSGMSRDDLALSLKRHATSKISTAEDLHRIQTLGFRGEALASISSVAMVEIRTRRADDDHGWQLVAEPMRDDIISAIQQEKGTQVFVRNLFFSIPARRKFLRSDVTEFRHISDTMIRFALSYPERRFTFHDGDSLIFDVKPQSLIDRIRELFGEVVAQSVVPVDLCTDLVQVRGFVGKPNIARSTRASQYFFLNHRAIANKALAHAVYQGFEHLIDKTQHPMYVLNISLDSEKIDVNVHPQKTEVKFDDERMMYNIVQESIITALRSHNLIPDVHLGLQDAQVPFEKIAFGPSTNRSDTLLVNTLTGEIISPEPQRQASSFPTSYSGGGAAPRAQGSAAPYSPPDRRSEWSAPYQSAFDALFNTPGVHSSVDGAGRDDGSSVSNSPKLLWQLHNKYIFMQTDDGVLVVDQHIAHERILYEKALKAMNEHFKNSQKLLFSVPLTLNATELALLKEVDEEIRALGYEYTLKNSELEIHGVPRDVRSGTEADSIHEILDQYAEYLVVRPTSVRDNLAASFGCRAAIKAGDALSFPQMKQLIDDLFQTQTPEVCPHGRPVMIRFELKEFDRRFGRTS